METVIVGKTSKTNNKITERPSVFEYTDFRKYLSDFLDYLRHTNPSYSATAFVRQAGFGSNSRGYFNLILNGKRNLSSRTILGFSNVMKLDEKEFHYFESIVHYSQAQTEKDKKYYFERLSKCIKGQEGESYELLKSQYNYFSNWYLIAIRELVVLSDFKNEPNWIVKKLRNRISRKQARDAIDDLLKLGLIAYDKNEKLCQCEEIVNFTDSSLNYTVVNNLHRQMLKISDISLNDDPYEERSTSCVVLATNSKNFAMIREEIKEFRAGILSKYGVDVENSDCVLNIGIQLNHLTPVVKK